jgi:hypothetical protein
MAATTSLGAPRPAQALPACPFGVWPGLLVGLPRVVPAPDDLSPALKAFPGLWGGMTSDPAIIAWLLVEEIDAQRGYGEYGAAFTERVPGAFNLAVSGVILVGDGDTLVHESEVNARDFGETPVRFTYTMSPDQTAMELLIDEGPRGTFAVPMQRCRPA